MTKVTKRSGTKEEFSFDKIHKVLGWATQDIDNVSISDIEMGFEPNLYDGISTKEINDALVRSAGNLISETHPEYQWVASRLALYMLRKEVWGESEPPRLLEHIKICVKDGVYDDVILKKYTQTEIHKLNKFIKHERDFDFTYAAIQQLIDKYLIKNRINGKIHETPQFAYMLIAMTLFQNYDKKVRLDYIKKCYDYFSTFKINIPTPIMIGVRTPVKRYTSCVLIDVDDTLNSIFSSASAVGHCTASRAGIGVNVGRIRGIGSSIRNGDVIHTGVIPFLKVFESTVKSCMQNSSRGGSATCNIPWWHLEIEDIIVLKNNAGTDDNRVRKLDYVVQFSKLFYERVVKDEYITLFSPSDVKELTDNFGLEDFDKLYLEAEGKAGLNTKKIKARKLLESFSKERLETGRIYAFNIDHANSHGPFINRVTMTNLCVEITFPTVPIQSLYDEDGEIGTCILAALNALNTQKSEYQDVCDIIVRILDELIDHQDYFLPAAKNFCEGRRALGVGFTNIAGLLASKGISYNSDDAPEVVGELAELLQFNLLKASCKLAQEKGKCSKFDETKYSQGILPQDTANKNAYKNETLDWNSLREDIKKYGLRHSTLTAQMPCEASSLIQNATNGVEPVRKLISFKRSKYGNIKQVVPYVKEYGSNYTLAFDCDNKKINEICAAIQVWFDMSISMNHYYDYEKYPDGLPLSELVKDMMHAYKFGIKSIYYTNTKDVDSEDSCISGACSV